jgi:uncharacterized protein YbjT (DUF2867 family)
LERAVLILVTAAGGKTARHVIPALKAKGLKVRAFVHHPRPDLEALGATEIVVGDLLKRDDLQRACQGVHAVIHTGPISKDEPVMGRWAIDAAGVDGVPHFIYVSVTHPQSSALLNHINKIQVEDHLIDSGMPYTILQPIHYVQNIDVRAAVERGVYSSAYDPVRRLAFVDLVDLADVAAKVASEPVHLYATYELCGTDYLDTEDVAALSPNAPENPAERS